MLGNLKAVEESLEGDNLPRVNQNEGNNLNRSAISKTEVGLKLCQQKINQDPAGFYQPFKEK